MYVSWMRYRYLISIINCFHYFKICKPDLNYCILNSMKLDTMKAFFIFIGHDLNVIKAMLYDLSRKQNCTQPLKMMS